MTKKKSSPNHANTIPPWQRDRMMVRRASECEILVALQLGHKGGLPLSGLMKADWVIGEVEGGRGPVAFGLMPCDGATVQINLT